VFDKGNNSKKNIHMIKNEVEEKYKKLSIRTNQNEKKKRIKYMGKRIIFSTDLTLTPEEMIDLYDREKNKVEEAFKLSKSPDIIRFQPVRHWTDSKVRIYALICVLSLLVIKLMVYKAKEKDIIMSSDVLCTELKDIREVLLLYSEERAERMLTTMSTIQKNLFNIFGLDDFAPPASK